MGAQGQRLVVVADDDAAMRLLCRVNLELEGYRVLEAESKDALAAALESEEVALVLLDIHLGSDDGIAVARGIRVKHPQVPIAFLSGSVRFGELSEAVSDASIRKPFTLEELIETVHRLARPPQPAPPPS
jgi:two-component system OmpR family response regulator